MDIFLNILAVCGGLAGLYFGAEWLVRGSGAIALKLGISPLVVGLTIVAFGTSAPELVVSLQFHLGAGKPDAALGNVVGSNICNIALILGVGALISPIVTHSQVLRREMPILLLVSLALVGILWDNQVTRWEGGALFAGIVAYTFFSLRLARNETAPPVLPDMAELEEGAKAQSTGKLVALIVFGLVTLVVGSKLLEIGAISVARAFGVSDAIIGLTLLAFGTSLPELATSVVASLKRHGDLISGNAIGSCIFNILLIVGVTALAKPMVVDGIEPLDLAFMVGLAVLVVPMMLWRGRQLGRFEGVLLLSIYVVYCFLLAQREGMI
ncbi:calcium/sodium antiporter [soil metagenome]